MITYDAVITFANPDLLLKPGMTATARITTAQALNVLRVPSQALRFTPSGAAKPVDAAAAGGDQRVIWVLRDGKLLPVRVTVGLDDDTFAEIKAGDPKPGDRAAISQITNRKAKAGAAPTASLRL